MSIEKDKKTTANPVRSDADAQSAPILHEPQHFYGQTKRDFSVPVDAVKAAATKQVHGDVAAGKISEWLQLVEGFPLILAF